MYLKDPMGLLWEASACLQRCFPSYGFLMGISSFSEEKCTHRTSIIGSILNGIFMVGWLAFFFDGSVKNGTLTTADEIYFGSG